MNNLPRKNKAFFLADIITQAILIGFTLIALVMSTNGGSAFFVLAIMLIPIGGYQMTSAAIHLFNGKQFPKIRRLRNVHFWGSLMYLLMVFAWIGPMGWASNRGVVMFFEMLVRAVPLAFAIGYFLLTLWDYRSHTVR
ncbi:hypothetical protein BKI52_07895 [marine bacterium AO1-C]|nr:hypothetical protein BKI52_07895 [marine bacterium AO1-C]